MNPTDCASVADSVSQNVDLYPLKRIIGFLDGSFGTSVHIKNYFPDVTKLIQSATPLQKVVRIDLLNGKKCYLRKFQIELIRG